jgi:hypothetical protein
MRTIDRARGWDFAAAATAGGLAVSEMVRLAIAGVGSNAHTPLMAIVGSSAFIAVLAVTAVGLALHRQVGWIFGVLGFLSAASHGVVLAAAGSAIGAVYIAASFGLFACIAKSLQFYRSEQRNEIVAT